MAHLVTAIIKPFKLEDVKEALRGGGILGLTVSEIQGYGRQGGKTDVYRGSEFTVDLLPKVRLEMVVADRARVERVVNLLAAAVRTGELGDGKVWVVDVEWVVSLRTGEMNEAAITP